MLLFESRVLHLQIFDNGPSKKLFTQTKLQILPIINDLALHATFTIL